MKSFIHFSTLCALKVSFNIEDEKSCNEEVIKCDFSITNHWEISQVKYNRNTVEIDYEIFSELDQKENGICDLCVSSLKKRAIERPIENFEEICLVGFLGEGTSYTHSLDDTEQVPFYRTDTRNPYRFGLIEYIDSQNAILLHFRVSKQHFFASKYYSIDFEENPKPMKTYKRKFKNTQMPFFRLKFQFIYDHWVVTVFTFILCMILLFHLYYFIYKLY